MNLRKLLFSKVITPDIFEDIIGYAHIKRLFKMALDSKEPVHILLSGLPSSGKTMFLSGLISLRNPILLMAAIALK